MTNSVIEAIKTRRSFRKYLDKPVEQALVDQVIEAGTYAASGHGLQPWVVIQVTDPAVRERLRRANAAVMGAGDDADPFYGAPVCLIVLADKQNANSHADCSLMMGNMMLAAHAFGLGSCWINRAREEFETPEWQAWLRSIGVEGDYAGVAHLVIGYPDGLPREAKPRKACVYRV